MHMINLNLILIPKPKIKKLVRKLSKKGMKRANGGSRVHKI